MKVQLNLVVLNETLFNHEGSFVFEENGSYEFDFPSATIQAEGATLTVVEMTIVQKVISELMQKIDKNTNLVIGRVEQKIKEVKKELKEMDGEISKISKEMEILEKENNDYKENYGEFITPSSLLHELYNGGRVAKDTFLIQKKKWKVKYLKSPKYQKSVNYWLNLFEDWGVFKSFGKGERVAKMTHTGALDYVYYQIRANKIKGTDD